MHVGISENFKKSAVCGLAKVYNGNKSNLIEKIHLMQCARNGKDYEELSRYLLSRLMAGNRAEQPLLIPKCNFSVRKNRNIFVFQVPVVVFVEELGRWAYLERE